MKNENVGKIIFSKVLQMPLDKYMAFIEKSIPLFERDHQFIPERQMVVRKKNYANLLVKDGAIIPEILDDRLQMRYSVDRGHERKVIFALRWINTRNEFSYHVLQYLIIYQRDYLFSGKEVDLKPLTFREFLFRFPCKYLDQSRLSRLVSNLVVKTLHNEIISLRSLFISRKRWSAYQVKQVVDENEDALTDSGIQDQLKKREIHLSVRTICNCRKLLNIPHHKERASHYYGRDIAFSDSIAISERSFNRIPAEPGVYELSIDLKISYTRQKSDVVYIGASRDLRKRIASYSGKSLKNDRLVQLVKGYKLFVRYCATKEYRALEKSLLRNFKSNYSELPKANINGGTP